MRLGFFQYDRRAFLVLCWLILFAASVYSGIHASNVQLTTSDQFITTYIFGSIDQGRPMISSDHTNLLKFPLLWLQEKLPYGYVSYVGLNILFVFSALGLWSILLGKILNRSVIPISLLVFSAILINSPTFALSVTMTTLRHIEYPLALLYLMGVYEFFKPRKKHLKLAAGMTLYLSLLLLNDKFFVYTLVPAALLSIVWLYHTGKHSYDVRAVAYAIASVVTGTALGLVLPKLLTATGLITIVSGYADVRYLISFGDILNSTLLSIQQTLELFGGSIFGQEIRKLNISLFMGLIIFLIAATGFIRANTRLKLRRIDRQNFLHVALIIFTLFMYLAYILPDFAKPYNARYLTAIVFIGATYFAYAVWIYSKQYKSLPYIMAVFLIATVLLSLPRVNPLYRTATENSMPSVLQAKNIANALHERDVRLVVTPGGHSDISFHSGGSVESIQLLNTCSTPSAWANNSAWIYEGQHSKTAFLVDTTLPDPTAKACPPDTIFQIYGLPGEIVPIATSKEGAKAIYIYNYDIRTKLNLSNIE